MNFDELLEKCVKMMIEDKIKGHTISCCGAYIDDEGKACDKQTQREVP